ncbi:MAG: hypothetical protein ACKOA8_16000 [Deltaproteobacteria bacterium]
MIRFKVTLKIGGILLLACVLSSCGKLDTPGSSGGTLTPSSPVTISQVFSISVGTIWETDTSNAVIDQGSCSISPTGTLSPNPCAISIPEAQLYYGKLRISATVSDKSKCSLLTFQPYYYQMSNLAGFTPPSATGSFAALDCSANPTPAGCYAGPATKLAPSFPTNTAVYYIPSATPDLTWTFDSPNTIRQSSNYNPGLRWFTNNLTDTATGQASIYVANSMVDYNFTCQDIYNDTLYSLSITLSATPGPSGYQHSHW